MFWRVSANLVLVIHALYVGFVVFALPAILIGGLCRWDWVRNRWFRGIHLAAIGVVVLQSWLNVVCPLTVFESYLRQCGGQPQYPDDFIGYWVHRLIFYQAPAGTWVFMVAYTLFGAAVLAALFLVPPRWRERPEVRGRR